MFRVLALLAAVTAATAAAALAQTAVFDPQMEQRPGMRAERVYPASAADRGLAGATVLCCRANADRTLTCRTAWETPTGKRFGRSAQDFMERSRQLTAASYERYQELLPNGGEFPIPMTFSLVGHDPAPPTPNGADQRALCAAPAP